MKTKLLGIIIALSALTASAQTEKGQNVIGGAASYSSERSNDLRIWRETYEYTVKASYGHFFAKNIAIGLVAGFNQGKSVLPSADLYDAPGSDGDFFSYGFTDTEYRYFTLGPYLRHYFKLSEKLKLYNEFIGTIGFGKQTNDYYFPGGTSFSGGYRSYNASINTGLAFFPTKKIAVELGFNLLSYTKFRTDYDHSNRNEYSKKFSVGLNDFRPMIGVSFHF